MQVDRIRLCQHGSPHAESNAENRAGVAADDAAASATGEPKKEEDGKPGREALVAEGAQMALGALNVPPPVKWICGAVIQGTARMLLRRQAGKPVDPTQAAVGAGHFAVRSLAWSAYSHACQQGYSAVSRALPVVWKEVSEPVVDAVQDAVLTATADGYLALILKPSRNGI